MLSRVDPRKLRIRRSEASPQFLDLGIHISPCACYVDIYWYDDFKINTFSVWYPELHDGNCLVK